MYLYTYYSAYGFYADISASSTYFVYGFYADIFVYGVYADISYRDDR